MAKLCSIGPTISAKIEPKSHTADLLRNDLPHDEIGQLRQLIQGMKSNDHVPRSHNRLAAPAELLGGRRKREGRCDSGA